MFDARTIDILRDIFADVCAHAQATRVERDSEDDDVHLLIQTASLSALSFPDLKDGLAARSGQHEQLVNTAPRTCERTGSVARKKPDRHGTRRGETGTGPGAATSRQRQLLKPR